MLHLYRKFPVDNHLSFTPDETTNVVGTKDLLLVILNLDFDSDLYRKLGELTGASRR